MKQRYGTSIKVQKTYLKYPVCFIRWISYILQFKILLRWMKYSFRRIVHPLPFFDINNTR